MSSLVHESLHESLDFTYKILFVVLVFKNTVNDFTDGIEKRNHM